MHGEFRTRYGHLWKTMCASMDGNVGTMKAMQLYFKERMALERDYAKKQLALKRLFDVSSAGASLSTVRKSSSASAGGAMPNGVVATDASSEVKALHEMGEMHQRFHDAALEWVAGTEKEVVAKLLDVTGERERDYYSYILMASHHVRDARRSQSVILGVCSECVHQRDHRPARGRIATPRALGRGGHGVGARIRRLRSRGEGSARCVLAQCDDADTQRHRSVGAGDALCRQSASIVRCPNAVPRQDGRRFRSYQIGTSAMKRRMIAVYNVDFIVDRWRPSARMR